MKELHKKLVNIFFCAHNQLTSLVGAPLKVGISFDCSGNKLTTLEGAPQEVGFSFDCSGNKLTSLVGGPKEVGGSFKCYRNKLNTLEGAPEKVGKLFNCGNNQLTSLDGAPKFIGSTFYCNDNKLTSLKGTEETICENLDCSVNNIYRLDFIPNYSNNFHIHRNPFSIIWRIIKDSIEKDHSLFEHFLENNIFRDPGYQGDNSGLPIIILDRLNDFLDMCDLPTFDDEYEGYTCI